MALMFFAATDADAGEWFVFQEDKDKGEKAEARVRRLPPAERERIERKHFGKTRRVTYTEQGAVQDLNREKQSAAVRERANYSLLDTRGFEIVVGGEDAQRRLSEILGQDVKIGETLRLDGKWNDALKDLIFSGLESFESWVIERAAEIGQREKKEEDEASGN